MDYSPEKIISILKTARYLDQFDESHLMQLVAFSSVETYLKGDRIIEEKKENKNIFILLEGCLEVYVGDELILNLRRKGDMIGEMSVITHSLTTASVVAASRVVLFKIPSEKIYESGRIDLQAHWFKLFSDILVEKLSMTNEKVVGFHEASVSLDHKKKELVHKTMILQSIMGSMTDGVVVFDGGGRVMQVNDSFVRMVGNVAIPGNIADWPQKLGIYRQNHKQFVQVEDLPMSRGCAGLNVDSHEIYIENSMLTPGVWLQVSASPLKSEDGMSLDGCVAVFRDFTKKKQEEAALIRAKENAEATAKAKSDFLAVMSHELRTPLNGILGMADLLKTTSLSENQAHWLEDIEKSGRALLGKIKNILSFNSLESGDIHIHKEMLSLDTIIEKVLKKHRSAAHEKGLSVETDICSRAKLFFYGDKEKIVTILDQLTDNAVKYTEKGGVRIRVTVAQENDSSVKFQVRVADTGIGIDQKNQETLFQPFSQADSGLSRKFEGTGLGLALAAKLVELMGGELAVESRLEKGTAFCFSLILDRAIGEKKGDAGPKSNIESLLNKDYAQSNPLDILVAEDNRVNQLLIKKVLNNLGYEVQIVENGLKALEACSRERFDLVLMDIQMPEMDGLTAAGQILNTPSKGLHPKIVALTANTADDIKEKCRKAGMVDYISKPLDVKTLVAVLEKISAGRSA